MYETSISKTLTILSMGHDENDVLLKTERLLSDECFDFHPCLLVKLQSRDCSCLICAPLLCFSVTASNSVKSVILLVTLI